jgi:hypothetical protein
MVTIAARMTVLITTSARYLQSDQGPPRLATTLSHLIQLSHRHTLGLQIGARNALMMMALTSQEMTISLMFLLKMTPIRLVWLPGLRSGE